MTIRAIISAISAQNKKLPNLLDNWIPNAISVIAAAIIIPNTDNAP